MRLLVYDEDEDEDVDVDEAEGALHLVRTREVATQFCGNDASIQTAYVPTPRWAPRIPRSRDHGRRDAFKEATDAAIDSLDPRRSWSNRRRRRNRCRSTATRRSRT